MQYFANSDRGRIRARNQDRYLMLPLGERAFLAAVFDGMGGHADGDLAADTALVWEVVFVWVVPGKGHIRSGMNYTGSARPSFIQRIVAIH